LRRISYDQAHDFHPTVIEDGRIMYSRWECMDRNNQNVFGVFSMNPDGSHQIEHFGNQLSAPAGLPCASWIPGGKGKFLSTTCQHMGSVYQGDLCLVDPSKGKNDKAAVTMVAPQGRVVSSYLSDADRKFMFPFALDEKWFLVSYCASPAGMSSKANYRLYLMDIDGNRELLAWNANQSICQPFPLCERNAPVIPSYEADYSKSTAAVRMVNAYYGSGTGENVPAGTIKKIRVVAIDYPTDPWFGNTGSAAHVSTPVSRFTGARTVKRIVGETRVESDGSAAFIVPARMPLYVQLIDSTGCMIQSMRSWMTLQPGEKFECYGLP